MTDATWQSMFDGGTCTVEALDWSTDPYTSMWSGTLGKGDSSDAFTYSDMSYTVTVDADGAVSLTVDLTVEENITIPSQIALIVTPSYDVSDDSIQMIDMTVDGSNDILNSSSGYAANIAAADITWPPDNGVALSWTGGADAVAPTPATASFDAMADAVAGFWVQAGGGG